jgi:acyl-CoA synthetase (AMP-forming)/AMP-acid ligase II
MAYTAASYARHVLRLSPEDICFSVPKIFFAYGLGNSLAFPFAAGASSVLMAGRPEPAAGAEPWVARAWRDSSEVVANTTRRSVFFSNPLTSSSDIGMRLACTSALCPPTTEGGRPSARQGSSSPGRGDA